MESNEEKTLSEILDELAESDLEENNSEILNILNTFWKYYKLQKRHNYHEITEYILKNLKRVKEGEAIPIIARKLRRLLDFLQNEWDCTDEVTYYDCRKYSPPFICDSATETEEGIYNCYDYKQLYRFLLKLYDHIQLEFIRWSEIRKETTRLNTLNRSLKSQMREIEEQQSSLKEQYKQTFSEFDDVKDQTRSIYLQVISVLGIFAAIIIAVFGGLNVINSISSAFLQGDITVYRTVLVACMCTLFVIWITFGLLSLARWTSIGESPGRFAIVLCGVITLICLGGIVYSLIQADGTVTATASLI